MKRPELPQLSKRGRRYLAGFSLALMWPASAFGLTEVYERGGASAMFYAQNSGPQTNADTTSQFHQSSPLPSSSPTSTEIASATPENPDQGYNGEVIITDLYAVLGVVGITLAGIATYELAVQARTGMARRREESRITATLDQELTQILAEASGDQPS